MNLGGAGTSPMKVELVAATMSIAPPSMRNVTAHDAPLEDRRLGQAHGFPARDHTFLRKGEASFPAGSNRPQLPSIWSSSCGAPHLHSTLPSPGHVVKGNSGAPEVLRRTSGQMRWCQRGNRRPYFGNLAANRGIEKAAGSLKELAGALYQSAGGEELRNAS